METLGTATSPASFVEEVVPEGPSARMSQQLLSGAGVVRVAESGVRDGADARRLQAAGYHAVLVGETLVTSADPAATVAELRGI